MQPCFQYVETVASRLLFKFSRQLFLKVKPSVRLGNTREVSACGENGLRRDRQPGFNMGDVVPNLEQLFESLLRTVHKAIEGLNREYDPNRADSFEFQLGDFVRTLNLMSSRFRACTAGSDHVLEDLKGLTNAVRMLQEN